MASLHWNSCKWHGSNSAALIWLAIRIITTTNIGIMPKEAGEHFPILSSLVWTLDKCTTHNTNSMADPAPDLEIGTIPLQKAGAKWQLLSTTPQQTIEMVCWIDCERLHLWSPPLALFSYPESAWCCIYTDTTEIWFNMPNTMDSLHSFFSVLPCLKIFDDDMKSNIIEWLLVTMYSTPQVSSI